MAATGSATIGDYLRFVQRHPEEQRVLIGTFLIKVTKFFRDADLFSTLRERILPEIIEAARARDHSIRLWSAGCATGEEAYSLAITLAECLGDEFDDFHVRIFATDLDADAVAFARQGLYAPSALSGVDAGTIQRHFDMADGGFQIAKRIRGLLVFGQHDLADRAPFPRVDLVLCRNVLIYFTTELQRSILQLFAFSLRDGGYLILGKSETTTPYADAFAPDDGRLKIYRRRGDRAALPVAPIREMIPPSTPRVIPSRPALHSHTLSTPARTAAEQTQIRRADSILFDLPIGVVVVDRRYDIQYINDAARLLLGVHSSALGEDLIHLVHTVPAAELRALIDQAVSSGGQCSGTLTAVPVGPDAPSHLHVICTADTSDQSAPVTTVCISDGTERVEERVRLESDLARATEARERAEQQGQHLVDTNREFLAANQQLTREMAELRRQNEEFLVGNEELQAAAEEVETLNEELQATNEELETLNEELQATVEELNTTNDDLQTRNLEIQELAISVEAARARLNAVLNSLGDAIVLVDSQGRTILTNGLYDELFPTPFELLEVRALDGSTLSEDQLPNRRAGRGEAFQMSASMPDADGNARALSVSAQPLHGEGSEGSDGGVLVIRRLGDAGDQG
jgi:two-component system CheB/CheR fusion protein